MKSIVIILFLIKMANLEYNVDEFNNQLYHIDSRGTEMYRNTDNSFEIFARRDGKPYYAKMDGFEYYPIIDNVEIPINENGYQQYVKIDNIEFYPTDSLGNEFVIMNGSEPLYARKQGQPYYPKSSNRKEQVIANKYLYNENGSVMYPTDIFNKPIYPMDAHGEYYVLGLDNRFSIAKYKNKNVYAKKKISETKKLEFYPPDGQVGYLDNNYPIYIFDEGKCIFPKDKGGNEYYLTLKYDTADDWITNVSQYAKDSQNNEIYPLINGSEVILNNTYAKKADNTIIYPLDLYFNEYTLTDDTLDIYPLGYPITHDRFIIISAVNNKPYISDTILPNVTIKDVKFLLPRENRVDYLTSIVSTRVSRKDSNLTYETWPLNDLPMDHYMTDENGNQMYQQNRHGTEMYIYTTDSTQIFAKRDGKPYYAKNSNQEEYYPKIKGTEIPSNVYIKRADEEYYPKDKFDNEYAIINGLKPLYAQGSNGSFYPKTKSGLEQVINDEYLYKEDDSVKYPLDKNQYEYYPRDSKTNDEYYVKGRDDKYSIIYLLGDEYPLYALDDNNDPIFPKNEQNDEYYLRAKNSLTDFFHGPPQRNDILPRYAEDHQGNDIYPKVFIDSKRFIEKILNDMYAVDADNKFIYPLDEYNNEYTLSNYPLGYPQTYDGFIIVPQVNGSPYILDDLSKENIVFLLSRSMSTDFLTNVKSTRPSRIDHGPKYNKLPFNVNDYCMNDYNTDADGNQQYPKNKNGREMYCATLEVTKLFAKRNGEPYYAKDEFGKEYYPTLHKIQIPAGRYIQDSRGSEMYPKDEVYNEYVILRERGEPLYAQKDSGSFFYPKTRQGQEQVINQNYIYEIDGSVKYPVHFDNIPFYPLDVNNDEYYVKGRHGKYSLNNYQYAKKKTGTEFYPPDNQILYKGLHPVYALDSYMYPIFPKDDENNEYYLKHKETEDDYVFSNSITLPRYATDHLGNEIYPAIYINDKQKTEFTINDMYTVDANGQVWYPLDEYNNEYTLKNEIFSDDYVYPLGYPQTFDRYIIVPQINSKPYISNNVLPKVPKNCILYTLERYLSKDYITEIKSARDSRKKMGFPYTKGKLVSKNNTFTIVFIICMLFAILAIFIKVFQ